MSEKKLYTHRRWHEPPKAEVIGYREIPEEERKENTFVDRSAQLRGALDSLALLNASRIKKFNLLEKDEKDNEDEEKKKKKTKKELSHLIDDFEKK